jgi:hypothetical protein
MNRGLLPTRKKDATTETQSYTCQNPSCGKVFTNPVKVENLCSKNAEVYNACPFCLTEITVEDSVTVKEKENLEIKNTEIEETISHSKDKKLAESPPKTQKCAHHFGYLSQRSSKEKIPEECMMCENIVQCMLKNVTG